jgi:hypothetical protein
MLLIYQSQCALISFVIYCTEHGGLLFAMIHVNYQPLKGLALASGWKFTIGQLHA